MARKRFDDIPFVAGGVKWEMPCHILSFLPLFMFLCFESLRSYAKTTDEVFFLDELCTNTYYISLYFLFILVLFSVR